MKIIDRYASALRSSNLKVGDERTTFGDPEVLGAMGLADKRLSRGDERSPPCPLAVPLQRLFLGDNHAAEEVVALLADIAWKRARKLNIRMTRVQSEDLSKACLAWHRNGTCQRCGGHGVLKIKGTTVLGSQVCPACKPSNNATYATGKIPFERNIKPNEHRPIAEWLVSEMERASGQAGPKAMKALADTLNL